MEIKRDRYLNLLISKKHNGLIKVITGMRRCGKSYLLFTLFKDYLLSEGIEKSHIIEIAFDAYENKQYRDPDVLYPYLKEKIKEIRQVVSLPPYIISSILSEIQNELKDEEKELLTIMLLQKDEPKEEAEDNAEDDILHDN